MIDSNIDLKYDSGSLLQNKIDTSSVKIFQMCYTKKKHHITSIDYRNIARWERNRFTGIFFEEKKIIYFAKIKKRQ